MKKRIKKVTSMIVLITLIVQLLPMWVFADNMQNSTMETVKERVSKIYGIPADVLDTLEEDYIRELDVNYDQVLATNETYVKISINEKTGKAVSVIGTKEEYLRSINPLIKTPDEDNNSWIKIYVIIVDKNSTQLDISSTYTWLTEPRVIYNAYDFVSLKFSTGAYVPGSASGFVSYKNHGITSGRDNLTDFDDDAGLVKCSYKMDDSGVKRNLFFQMKITVSKAGTAINAYSTYGHQDAQLNWTGVIGGAAGISSYLATGGGAAGMLGFIAGVTSVFGSIDRYYEQFVVKTYATF